MSDLIKWFEKRKEAKALKTVERHLALTTGIIEDLEKALEAFASENTDETQRFINRVADGEKEADRLRRSVMDEISRGELSPPDRADLMALVKRVDMVADWSRESTRILNAMPSEDVPKAIKDSLRQMIRSIKECTRSLQRCINKIDTKAETALEAADQVEREEEKVDDIHENARALLVKTEVKKAGIAVLVGQLFEAMEMIADSCEDAADQVRVIIVRR